MNADLDRGLTGGQIVRSYVRDSLRSTGRRLRKNWTGYFFLLPFFLLFFTFVILPVVISIWYSFTYYNILSTPKFIGFKNYLDLFIHDDVFMIAVKNTFVFAVITGPVGYLASLMFAWFINELPGKVRAVMVTIFYAPSISGAVYLIWTILFSGDSYGYINSVLISLGFINDPIQWLADTRYMASIVILVTIWMSLGAGFLSFVAGFQGLDSSLVEAGMIDGISNRWQGAVVHHSALHAAPDDVRRGHVHYLRVYHRRSNHRLVRVSQYGLCRPYDSQSSAGLRNGRYEMGYASAIATVLFLAMLVTNQLIQLLLRRVGK